MARQKELNQNQLPGSNASTRTHYDVEAGDSLASIAQKKLSDTRFARLIFTINRGEIPIRCDGFNTFAFIFPGQRVLLPTSEEAAIYKKNFLTESSRAKFDLAHYARPAMPSDSIPTELIMPKTARGWGEPIAQKNESKQTESDYQSHTSLGNSHIELNRTATKYSITPSIRQDSSIPQFTPVHSQHHAESNAEAQLPTAVPTMEFKPQSESMSGVRTIDMSPPTADSPRIEEPRPPVKSAQFSGSSIQQADDQDLFFSQGSLELTTLSHYCRVMKFESMSDQNQSGDLLVKLQVFDNQRWQTISTYSIRKEQTQRSAHYADGTVDTVNIDLPTTIARELSVNDFTKNWKNYTKVYFNQKEKSKLEQIMGGTANLRTAV